MEKHSAEVIYIEYMYHARHIESQRQAFATVFTAVFGGLIVFVNVSGEDVSSTRGVVFFFLMIFSVFGFFITAVWNASFVKFTRLAERISIEEFETPIQFQRFSKHRKFLSAARIFIAFYSLMVGLSFTMLVNSPIKMGIYELNLSSGATLCISTIVMLGIYLVWVERRVRLIDKSHREFAIDQNGRI